MQQVRALLHADEDVGHALAWLGRAVDAVARAVDAVARVARPSGLRAYALTRPPAVLSRAPLARPLEGRCRLCACAPTHASAEQAPWAPLL